MTGHHEKKWFMHQVADGDAGDPEPAPRHRRLRCPPHLMCLRISCVHPFTAWRGAGLGIQGKDGGETVDWFSRSGMNLIGLLLLLMIVLAIYELSDVAIKRWFG
jgi:hypothetical protein